MSSAVEKAVEALELLPEEMREKFHALKDAIDEGMADVEAGRVVPWDLEDFLKRARAQARTLVNAVLLDICTNPTQFRCNFPAERKCITIDPS
jgi:predicted transcriptional regulator